MQRTLITNARVINEGKITESDVLIVGERIEKIGNQLSDDSADHIDAAGSYLVPGVIDDQVHFREPGLTHKANIYTEAKAAVAGGVTSFMEMPNTNPQAVTIDILEEKYSIASKSALANYSFFMGATNNNLDELMKVDGKNICGIKIFMGSSTGNMLVDDARTLEGIFSNSPLLIALHCEDEQTIRSRTEEYKAKYGEEIPFRCHPEIRNEEACYLSSSHASDLAKKYGTRIHILHISTAKELELFRNDISMKDKNITSEVCVHHLTFDASEYDEMGSLIKCNPAIKYQSDQDALWVALNDDRLDVIATDHAPHTWDEKSGTYLKAPSGLPLVQHSLVQMFEHAFNGKISLEKMIDKMCHKPAEMFKIIDRGFVREGYFADLVLVDPQSKWKVAKENVLYKCGWSPFEGREFQAKVTNTWVSGHHVFNNGTFNENKFGQRMKFDR